MKGFLKIAFCLGVLLLNTGCASKLMEYDTITATKPLAENQASVTFFRPAVYFGDGIDAPLAVQSYTDGSPQGELQFIGASEANNKIRYIVDAGEYLFVVGGENSTSLSAKLSPNKNYYVRVMARPGFWKARFSLIPISPEEMKTEKFKRFLVDLEYKKPSSTASTWWDNNKTSMETKAKDAINTSDIGILPENYGVDEIY